MTRQKQLLIRADAEIRGLLESLCGACEQQEADALLARAVWSRLTEPGDATAGALLGAVGPLDALDFLVSGTGARSMAALLEPVVADSSSFSARHLSAAIKRWLPRLDRTATVQDLALAASAGISLLTPESEDWPRTLLDLGPHAPHALWVRGDRDALSTPTLAVVGARACTTYGSQITADLAGEACAAGFTVVSGAAYGIDAVAHRTALATDARTVAVLAGGADRPYPASHEQLIGRIAEQGAVCSEVAPGTAPTRWRFLQRNRLISALSRAVLVTEAGVRSGTLNTAGHGAELGRPIGAVPGPITSPASTGCHRLVREYGATLVTNGAELLELLGVPSTSSLFADVRYAAGAEGSDEPDGARRPSSLHIRLLDALPLRGGRTLADVARLAGVSEQDAAGALAELEVLGEVARRETPGGGEEVWTMLRRQ